MKAQKLNSRSRQIEKKMQKLIRHKNNLEKAYNQVLQKLGAHDRERQKLQYAVDILQRQAKMEKKMQKQFDNYDRQLQELQCNVNIYLSEALRENARLQCLAHSDSLDGQPICNYRKDIEEEDDG